MADQTNGFFRSVHFGEQPLSLWPLSKPGEAIMALDTRTVPGTAALMASVDGAAYLPFSFGGPGFEPWIDDGMGHIREVNIANQVLIGTVAPDGANMLTVASIGWAAGDMSLGPSAGNLNIAASGSISETALGNYSATASGSITIQTVAPGVGDMTLDAQGTIHARTNNGTNTLDWFNDFDLSSSNAVSLIANAGPSNLLLNQSATLQGDQGLTLDSEHNGISLTANNGGNLTVAVDGTFSITSFGGPGDTINSNGSLSIQAGSLLALGGTDNFTLNGGGANASQINTGDSLLVVSDGGISLTTTNLGGPSNNIDLSTDASGGQSGDINLSTGGAPIPGAIIITTNGAEAARVTADNGGFVGIGATAPLGTELFLVDGDAHITGKLTLDGILDPPALVLSGAGQDLYIDSADGLNAADAAAGHGRLRYNHTAKAWQASVDGGTFADILTGPSVNGWTNGGDSFGAAGVLRTNDGFDLFLGANGTNRVRIAQASGAVSFGSVALSPAAAVQVYGGDGAQLRVGNSNTAFTSIWQGAADATIDVNLAVNGLNFLINGTPMVRLNNSGALLGQLGVVSNPEFAFLADQNTGMWSPSADVLAWSTGGVEAARITTAQDLLLGATAETFSERLNVTKSYTGDATNKHLIEAIASLASGTDTGSTVGIKVAANALGTSVGGAMIGAMVSASQQSTAGSANLTALVLSSLSTAVTNAGLVASGRNITSTLGFTSVTTGAWTAGAHIDLFQPVTGAALTIGTVRGLRIRNQGNTGVTDAFGIDIEAMSSASGSMYGIRSAAPINTIGAINFANLAASGDANARMSLSSSALSFGVGGATAVDQIIARAAGQMNFTNNTGTDEKRFLQGSAVALTISSAAASPGATQWRIALGGTPASWNSAEGALFFRAANVNPAGNPIQGFYLYVDTATGTLSARGPLGTVTPLAVP